MKYNQDLYQNFEEKYFKSIIILFANSKENQIFGKKENTMKLLFIPNQRMFYPVDVISIYVLLYQR